MNTVIKQRKIYTLGYEKMNIECFLNLLKLHDIQIVVDVRDKPYSRNKSFSRKNLVEYLRKAQIDYLHLQALGTSQSLRNKVRKDSDYSYFFREYEKHLQSQKQSLELLHKILHQKTLCLLCYEKDARLCHRLHIAEKLTSFASEDCNYHIIHL